MDIKLSQTDFVQQQHGKLRDSYKIGEKLGNGAFSSVRAIKFRATGEQRAVKIIQKKSLKNKQEWEMMFSQVGILRVLDHPNIIRLFEYYQDQKSFYIITQRCNGGDLFEAIIENGSFSQAMAADFMGQILQVLVYIHQRYIAHRDLKPENFLIHKQGNSQFLKVIDFGSAQQFTPGRLMTKKVGTPYYIAPQILNKQYTQSCDIWSAGVIMYIMLCGFPPFRGNNSQEIIQKVRNGRFSYPSPDWDFISFEAKDLINKMLELDFRTRITAKDALAHPWLTHASQMQINQQIAVEHLNNLRNFRSQQVLQKATISFISSQLATSGQRQELVQLFKSLDSDESGTLSRIQLIQGYHKLFGDQLQDIESQVDRIMKEVDIDHSGEIDYSEFVTATMNRHQLLSRERLQIAFQAFDLDNSGSISAEELKSIFGKNKRHEEALWQELIKEVDQNGDGEIDFEEFVSMMMSLV